MAASVTVNEKTVLGNQRVSFSTVTLDSTYPTGGESVTASQLGLSSVKAAFVNITAVNGTVNVANAFYDVANSKVKAFDETPAEVANGTDLSGTTVVVVAFGK